jgi:hypothetical protein
MAYQYADCADVLRMVMQRRRCCMLFPPGFYIFRLFRLRKPHLQTVSMSKSSTLLLIWNP